MKLSNKKIKYIKRHTPEKTSEEIAQDLHIRVSDVEEVLGLSTRQHKKNTIFFLDVFFRWGMIIFILIAPFVFIYGLYDFANLPQMAFIQTGIVFFLLVLLIRSFLIGEGKILRSPLNLPIFLFILWSFISVLYAHNKYEGMLLWMHWTASFLAFFLILNSIRTEKDSDRLMIVLFISGFLTALLGIAQYLFEFSWVPQVGPPAAAFAQANMAVHFIILTFPLALGIILNSKTWGRILILSLMSALMIVYLVYAKTRAGWVAFAVESVFFAILMARDHFLRRDSTFWNRTTVLIVLSSVLMIVVMINIGPQGFEWGFEKIVDEAATIISDKDTKDTVYTSRQLRLDIWLNTLEMIKDRPLIGFGLGNHKIYYPLYYRKAAKEKLFGLTRQLVNVHNDYLQISAEVGIIGILFLVWILFMLIKVVFSLTSLQTPRRKQLQAIGISVAIVGFLVNACFSFPLQRAVPPFALMILIGLLGFFYSSENRKFYFIRNKWVLLCACVLVLATLMWLIRLHYMSIKCDRHYFNIPRLVQSKNWPGVIEEGKWAYHYNPERVRTLSFMGRAYIEMGKYQEGISVLKKVINAYPNYMNALTNLGVAYDRIRNHKAALETYEKVLRIKPDYSKIHYYVAKIYMSQNNQDKALEEFRLAAEFDSGNSIIHFNIGRVEMQKKHYSEAAAAFEKAVQLNPKWDIAHKLLGILYFEFLNKREDGIHHIKKAIKLNPKIKDEIRGIVSSRRRAMRKPAKEKINPQLK